MYGRKCWLAALLMAVVCPQIYGGPPAGGLPAPRPVESDRADGSEPLVPTASRPPGLTLPQVEEFAVRSHPSLDVAGAAIDEAAGRAVQAGLYPNPEFLAGATQLGGRNNQLPITLSQRFVTAGKLSLQQAAALKEVRQAELRFQQTHFEVLTRVRQAYYAALIGQRRIETLTQLTDLQTRSRELAVQLKQGGQGTETDVLLLEVELQQTRADLDNAEAFQAGLLRQLAAVTGSQPDLAAMTLDGDLAAPVAFPEFAAMREALPAVNPEASIARTEVDRQQILRRRADVEPIPDVTLTAGYQRNTSPDEVTNNLGVLTVGIPIPVWNRNQGNRAAAMAAIRRAMADYGVVQLDLDRRLAAAWGRYAAAQAQIERYAGKLLPAAERTVSLTRKGYEAGQIDLIRLFASQRSLVQARLGYLDVQGQQWQAAAEIAGLLQLRQFPPAATPPAGTPPPGPIVPPAQ